MHGRCLFVSKRIIHIRDVQSAISNINFMAGILEYIEYMTLCADVLMAIFANCIVCTAQVCYIILRFTCE